MTCHLSDHFRGEQGRPADPSEHPAAQLSHHLRKEPPRPPRRRPQRDQDVRLQPELDHDVAVDAAAQEAADARRRVRHIEARLRMLGEAQAAHHT